MSQKYFFQQNERRSARRGKWAHERHAAAGWPLTGGGGCGRDGAAARRGARCCGVAATEPRHGERAAARRGLAAAGWPRRSRGMAHGLRHRWGGVAATEPRHGERAVARRGGPWVARRAVAWVAGLAWAHTPPALRATPSILGGEWLTPLRGEWLTPLKGEWLTPLRGSG